MAATEKMHNAKSAKNDEFYTQLTDVSKELMHYKQHFKDKIIFCNCDDPTWSAFWKYFHLNFSALGLKKLISTHYDKNAPTYKMEYTGGDDNNISAGVITRLEGNGDFRNQECLDLLDASDIVVTNPPFSLFREFVTTLVEHKKDYLIIGNTNALACMEIFKLFQADAIRTGYTNFNVGMFFRVPDTFEKYTKIENGHKMARVSTSCWFTSLPVTKHTEKLILWKTYSPEEYPTYDNYNAINVNKYTDIPCDYDGIMGVPITFLDKWNPEQFELLGCTQRGCHDLVPDTKKYDDYKEINYKTGEPTGSSGSKTNENANLVKNDGKHNYFINAEGHIVQSTYSRIFIRKKVGV